MTTFELHRLWKNAASDAEWHRQALESSDRQLSTMHRLAAAQAKTIYHLKEKIEFMKEHLAAAREHHAPPMPNYRVSMN
jgi:uncharacterized membrane protein YccC